MVLSVLNSDPSLRKAHSGLSPEKIPASPPKNNRRSRAHNIPGGIKHLLSDPKRRRHARSTSLPSSHRSHPRRLARRKPTAKQILLASAALASEAQPSPSPQSRSRSQSHASVPISVSFPRRLPVLPRKQMSSEVLASLGFTSEVPSQYIRDQMERLGPMLALLYLFHHITHYLWNLYLVCIGLCGPPRQQLQGQRYPRHSSLTSMTKHQ